MSTSLLPADLSRRSFLPRRPGVLALRAGALLTALLAVQGSYFIVPQNEVASVLRLGALNRGPLAAGPHWKLPFADRVYAVMISKQNLTIRDVVGKTSTNQRVTFHDLNVTWHVEPADANTAMFKVGGLGTEGIADNFVPVVRDRTLRVLGRYGTTDINAKKEQIAGEVLAEAGPQVHDMFGVTLDSVQIPQIEYDPAFEESVAAAIRAQNARVQAEAQLAANRVQAEQQEVQARGQAAAQIAAAEAEARKQVLAAGAAAQARQMQADADAHAVEVQAIAQAHATRLQGDADAAALAAKISAFGTPALYNESLQAAALGRWNGSVPQMVVGDKVSPAAFLPLPVPAPTPTPSR